ncbi:MAG TPA: GNAT family N-acetyltransferase, partial [Armatimonadota bacterium]|nr:GNAT family N-acetyltransferase [Armatimonadota bacterium]
MTTEPVGVEVTIREIAREDVDCVCGIIKQHSVWDAAKASDEIKADLTDIMAGVPRGHHYVAEIDGEIVGVSGWHRSCQATTGVYWLSWTYVDEARRRSGIASKLLHHVIDAVTELGGRKLYIDTGANGYEDAVSFYKRHGFQMET